jgi:hypothetical protein
LLRFWTETDKRYSGRTWSCSSTPDSVAELEEYLATEGDLPKPKATEDDDQDVPSRLQPEVLPIKPSQWGAVTLTFPRRPGFPQTLLGQRPISPPQKGA